MGELVRKISPAYYVRHKVAQCHETNGVFLMVQQFLDTELVISYIGCQKLDVIALSHMVNAGLSKCWGAWGSYLDMLQEKRMCLAHLFNRDLSRAWRAWEHKMHEAELMAKSVATLRNLEAK